MNKVSPTLFADNSIKLSGAQFSNDRRHRYGLWRIWDDSRPLILFIGLNPSTASENADDPTLRRVIGFARKWDYGGLYMANLFSFVSTYPKALFSAKDPTLGNEQWLKFFAAKCSDILFAWGSFPGPTAAEAVKRGVETMFPSALCLGFTKDGSPRHPLYLPSDVVPQLYRLPPAG